MAVKYTTVLCLPLLLAAHFLKVAEGSSLPKHSPSAVLRSKEVQVLYRAVVIKKCLAQVLSEFICYFIESSEGEGLVWAALNITRTLV